MNKSTYKHEILKDLENIASLEEIAIKIEENLEAVLDGTQTSIKDLP